MNKYSQWLLVSDIDGTLNDKTMNLPEVNKVAVKNFVDSGGKFTLCSGRNLESLMIHYKKLNINTPAICLNGAGIYDVKNNKTIYYNPITSAGEEIIFNILKKFKTVQLTVFDMDCVYLYTHKCLYGYIISKLDKLTYKLCKKRDSLPNGEWGKVSLFAMPWTCKKIEKILKNEENKLIFDCFYTSPFTLEVVNFGVNKGTAVQKLAQILNISDKNVGAIGDYYNDEAMLRAVHHPVCCGQAPDDLKNICEYIACHCNNGAVNDFIKYIENTYIQK